MHELALRVTVADFAGHMLLQLPSHVKALSIEKMCLLRTIYEFVQFTICAAARFV